MSPPSTPRVGARGRPPRVTEERLRQAILEIEGEVPTMASLARQLGVGVATLYSHVRGQDELRRLAADAVFDAWELPPAPPGTHWAHWVLDYARDARRMAERYPAVHGARPLAGGQLRYVERVLAQLTAFGMSGGEAIRTFGHMALLVLGVGAQIEATRLEEARAGLEIWGLFQDALSNHPGELPVLTALERGGVPDPDASFDELVWFTLIGIARRRGEVLPTRVPRSASA
ncbi:MAG: TetR/AcrR family transcriptional regulator C-terminal domain-containing protein [Proteobacteria bacterium]|nr:TetR/AcrR family transcriptional regulator C-terminal domain-containing protein [Pseudomonadota bacterium]